MGVWGKEFGGKHVIAEEKRRRNSKKLPGGFTG